MSVHTEQQSMMMGEYGAKMVAASSAQTSENFSAIEFLAEGTLSVLTGSNMTGTWTGITFAQGHVIYGNISAYTADVTTIAYQHAA